MKIPTGINYKNKFYEKIKLITINNYNFLIVENNNKLLKVEMIETENNNPLFKIIIDFNDTPNISEHILIDYILNALQNEIENNKFSKKEDLESSLTNIIKYINETNITEALQKCNEQIRNDDFNKNIISLLEFLDKKLENNKAINFKNLKHFEIGNNEYFKFYENGKVKILIDTPENKELIEKIKSKVSVENTIPLELVNKVLPTDTIDGNLTENDAPLETEIEHLSANAVNDNSGENNISSEMKVEALSIDTVSNNSTEDNTPLEVEIEFLPTDTIDDNLPYNKTPSELPKEVLSTTNIDNSLTEDNPPSKVENESSQKKKKLSMANIFIILFIVAIICGIYSIYLILAIL